MQFAWRWNDSTISLNLGVVWEMSAYSNVVDLPLYETLTLLADCGCRLV
jgi:hypothetical protein